MNSSATLDPETSSLFVVGSRVYCALYGGRDGTIFAIHGQQQPETIRSFSGGAMVSGGRAYFDIVFDDGAMSLKVPESIVRGVQWSRLDGIDTPEMIAARLAHAEEVRVARETAAREEAEAKRKERAELPAQFPVLKTLDGTSSSHALGAANLRKHLKKAFPGVKFSVTSKSYSGGDSIDVRWELGPTVEEVRKISDRYQESDFDGMQDLATSRRAVWPEVFGGASYVSEQRSTGDAHEVVCQALAARSGVPYTGLWTQLPNLGCCASDYAHRLLCKVSIPVGATVTGIEWPEGQTAGDYRVTYTQPAAA